MSSEVLSTDSIVQMKGDLPPLVQLYFYLTEGCNLACRHCWIAPRYDAAGRLPSLPVELFRKAIAEAKPLGLKAVKLTGGEPLMHPQILELIGIVRSEGLGPTVETNGVFCTPEIARELAGAKAFVSVSLDGADAKTHEWVRGVTGCFDAAVQGLGNLVAAGLRPQVIMSLMRCNVDQLEAMLSLAKRLGTGSVKFNIVQPTSRGEVLADQGEALSVPELLRLGRMVESEIAPNAGISIHYDYPPAFRSLSRLSQGCGRCHILNILGVLSDGSYALCGIGYSVPELVFGRVGELQDVWEGNEILKSLRRDLPEGLQGVCRDCLMKNLCMGSCVAQNYYTDKSLFSAFWFCQEAPNRGLFPSTRIKN
jgi:SynChlorMet cassette radical SAM/SPASM protein ScmF